MMTACQRSLLIMDGQWWSKGGALGVEAVGVGSKTSGWQCECQGTVFHRDLVGSAAAGHRKHKPFTSRASQTKPVHLQ